MGTRAGAALSLLVVFMAATVGLGCYASVDPTLPIVLEVDEGFGDTELLSMRRAAMDWNASFDTQLRFQSPGSYEAGQQRVPVYLSDRACLISQAFVEQHGATPEVAFCSVNRSSTGIVFRHELGHVLNIAGHGSSDAVMGQNERSCFSLEDHELFEEANPGYRARLGFDGPQATALLAQSWLGAVGSASGQAVLLDRNGELLWRRLSPEGRLVGTYRVVAAIERWGLPQLFPGAEVSAASSDGKILWFRNQDGELLGQVAWPRTPSDVVTLGARLIALIDGDLYALQSGSLVKLAKTGLDLDGLLVRDGRLYGYHLAASGFTLAVFDAAFAVAEQRSYPLPVDRAQLAPPVAVGDGIFVASRSLHADTSGQPAVHVMRVDAAGPLLGSHSVGAIGVESVSFIASAVRLHGAGDELRVTLTDTQRRVAQIDPTSLKLLDRWRWLGQACSHGKPEIVAGGDGVFAIWRDSMLWVRRVQVQSK
jgi:hypothetical protein